MLRERLKELIHELNCIEYGEFELASGGVSDYKIVCDRLFLKFEPKYILGRLGSDILSDIEERTGKRYDIVGVVTGGFEFAKLVAEVAERKDDVISVNPHNGEVKAIPEKEINIKFSNLCYFEDVVTKGGSVLKCRNILEKHDGKDDQAISIINRQEGGEENLEQNGIKLNHILTKNDLEIKNQ